MYIPDDNCTIINFQNSRFNEKTARNTHEGDYDRVCDFANTQTQIVDIKIAMQIDWYNSNYTITMNVYFTLKIPCARNLPINNNNRERIQSDSSWRFMTDRDSKYHIIIFGKTVDNDCTSHIYFVLIKKSTLFATLSIILCNSTLTFKR